MRLAPGRWAALLHGLSLACLIVGVWALASKVFPAALAPDETYARLREPFGYWNAIGLMAALGVPPLLWLAARRSGSPAANALAWPALGLLFTCLMLSYSRGALLALGFGLVLWFAAVPLRLRGALPLIGAALVSAPVIAWAFTRDALTTDRVPLVARADAGQELGALLVLMTCVLLALGLAVNFTVARRPPGERTRRLVGRALIGALALVPVALLIALAVSPGGLDGQVSKRWKELTDPAAATPTNTPDRLAATSSVRARYWRESWTIYENSPNVGAGAGAYETARTRYRSGTPGRAPRPRLRGPDARRPRAHRRAAVADRERRVARRRHRRHRAAAARPRPAVGPGADRAADDGHRRRRVRRPLADRLDVVRARQRRTGAAVRGVGRRPRAAAHA